MTNKQIAVDYLRRAVITTLPIPFLVFGFNLLGLPSNVILWTAFGISAILLEIELYYERKHYVR